MKSSWNCLLCFSLAGLLSILARRAPTAPSLPLSRSRRPTIHLIRKWLGPSPSSSPPPTSSYAYLGEVFNGEASRGEASKGDESRIGEFYGNWAGPSSPTSGMDIVVLAIEGIASSI